MGCIFLLILSLATSLGSLTPDAMAAMNRSQAEQRQQGSDGLPFIFFYPQSTDGSECQQSSVSLCRGMLANYLNYVVTVTLRVSVIDGAGSVINYPASILANDRTGQCDTYLSGGTEGPAGALMRRSQEWADNGTESASFRFSGFRPLLSCGEPQSSSDVFPGCEEGDFYQLIAQIAFESPATIEVEWTITTVSLDAFTGVASCSLPAMQPEFNPTDFSGVTEATTASTTSTSVAIESTLSSTAASSSTTESTLLTTVSTATESTLAPTTICSQNADLVMDGRIDILDIAKLVDYLDTGRAEGDLNCDGLLNTDDVQVVLSQWTL